LAYASTFLSRPFSKLTITRLAPLPIFGRPRVFASNRATMSLATGLAQRLRLGQVFLVELRHLRVAFGVGHRHEPFVIGWLELFGCLHAHRRLLRRVRFSGSFNGRAWMTYTTSSGEKT
jgi:hypothetical protein